MFLASLASPEAGRPLAASTRADAKPLVNPTASV
jgi:hypothetical protein